MKVQALFVPDHAVGKYAVKVGKPHKGTAEYGRWKCNVCGFIAESRAKLFKHTKLHRVNPDQKYCWNKGLTKETDPRLKKAR